MAEVQECSATSTATQRLHSILGKVSMRKQGVFDSFSDALTCGRLVVDSMMKISDDLESADDCRKIQSEWPYLCVVSQAGAAADAWELFSSRHLEDYIFKSSTFFSISSPCVDLDGSLMLQWTVEIADITSDMRSSDPSVVRSLQNGDKRARIYTVDLKFETPPSEIPEGPL